MASGARAAGAAGTRSTDRNEGRTPAQWFCYIFGATLILVGLIGFLANSTFDTGRDLQGDPLLGIFDVNGWHNIVHLASGAFLLAMAPKRATAKTAAIAFGLIYAVVTVIGLIDGSDVLNLLPINAADNVLHIALTAAALLAGFTSKANDENGAGRTHSPDADGARDVRVHTGSSERRPAGRS